MTFEKLRVYIAAEQLRSKVTALLPQMPREREHDAKQLGRAVSSTPYNIAEACGVGRRDRQGRKINHLEIARGSADETRAVLNGLTNDGILPESITRPLMILARTVAKMLTAWINNLNNNAHHPD
ncbi:MAG: four helix bundle protein [Gemmatimonadota bacterium]